MRFLSVELSESSVSLAVGVYSINSNFSSFGNSLNFEKIEKQTMVVGKTKLDARKNQLRFFIIIIIIKARITYILELKNNNKNK